MIIGISGKIDSGKTLIGDIIQCLIYCNEHKNDKGFYYDVDDWLIERELGYLNDDPLVTKWKLVAYADALKDIVCILTGCTRKQLENSEFKNKLLDDCWIRYGYTDGFSREYTGNGKMSDPIMNNRQCSEERYKEELIVNWQTAYKSQPTYRQLLQFIGTDLLRNQLNENVWINALFNKYIPAYKNNPFYDDKGIYDVSEQDEVENPQMYPNWIITDVRFINEADAIKSRNGILIRVNRNNTDLEYSNHPSEIELDTYLEFDYEISNVGTIKDLVKKVKEILIKERII
jgi:hypothetical protein